MSPVTRIRVTETDGVLIVRFLDRQLFDDRSVREANDQVAALLPNLRPGDGLVLDLTEVSNVSSSFVGKLVLLQRRVDALGGRLRLCELSQAVQAVLRTTNLDRIFTIDRDLRESLASLTQGP